MRRTVRSDAVDPGLNGESLYPGLGREALKLTLIAVALNLALLGVGCTTIVDVTFDERRDFSHYRTWDWLLEMDRLRVSLSGGSESPLERSTLPN